MVLDVSFVLALVGGGIVLRARCARPTTWIVFGILSVCVGAFLLATTYGSQSAMAAVASSTSTTEMLGGC
jgi:hypothetical protein